MNQFMFSKICIDHRVRNTKRVVPIDKIKVKTDIKTGGNYFMDFRITFPKDKPSQSIIDLVTKALNGVASKVERIK